MIPHPELADVVLVAAAAVLFYAAVTDLRHYKIGNELILLLLAFFVVHTALSGRWSDAAWSVALAAVVFAFLLYFYSRRWMGGGDVKLVTVAFLWTGLGCALPFAVLLLMFASLHAAAARFGWVDAPQRTDEGRARIAFAPSVAAALITVFVLGCLRPPL
jgi:prepilin peptidase CpaA